jgi:SAM-dependent methyltransferase
MLAVAGKVCPPSIEWIEASMEAIPRPDESFDAVLSQYALQFVPDKRAALKEVHRVLVPSGGLVITVPGKTPEVMEIAHDTIGRHIGEDAAAFLRAVFSLHDPGENRRLYEDAGFNGINVRVSSKKIVLPPPKDFLWGYIHSTPLSGVVHEASEASRAALERDTVDRWQPFVQDGGMVMQVETVTTTAMK